MQLTDGQLFDHCQCGHDRRQHYADGRCQRCAMSGLPECREFVLAEAFTASERQAPRRPMPSDPIDFYQRCGCCCPRGEHDGPLMLGKCSGCNCQRFTQGKLDMPKQFDVFINEDGYEIRLNREALKTLHDMLTTHMNARAHVHSRTGDYTTLDGQGYSLQITVTD
jgi:hypothetical protein